MNSSRRNNNTGFKKRPPPKSFTRTNDIYLTNKTDFNAQLKKAIALLNGEKGEIFLHSIGNAINRAINLALKLEEDYSFKYEVNTSTINLIDDKHPLNDEEDFSIRKRINSCIHIRVYRPFLLANESTNNNKEEPERMIKI